MQAVVALEHVHVEWGVCDPFEPAPDLPAQTAAILCIDLEVECDERVTDVAKNGDHAIRLRQPVHFQLLDDLRPCHVGLCFTPVERGCGQGRSARDLY